MAGFIRLLAAAEADDMDEASGRRQRETGKRSRTMTHEEDEDLDDIDTLAFQNEMMSSSSRVRGNVSMSEMFTRIASKLEETTATKKLDDEDDDDAPLNLSSSDDDDDEEEGAVSVINPIHIGTKTMRGIVQVPEITAEDREYPLREDGYPRPSRQKARGEDQEEGQEGDDVVQGAQEGRRGPEYVVQYKEAREKLNSNPYYKFLTLVAGASNVPVTRIVNQNKALEKLIEESSIRNRQRVSLAKRLSQIDTLKKRIQDAEARTEITKETRDQLDHLEDKRADLERLLKNYDMRDRQAIENNLLLRRSLDSLVLIEYASNQGQITADSFAEAAEYYQMQREEVMAGGLPPPPLARGRRRGGQSASVSVVKEEEEEDEGDRGWGLMAGDEYGDEASRQLVTVFNRSFENMMSVNSRLQAPDWVPNSVLVRYRNNETTNKIVISLTLGLQFLLYESEGLMLDPLASIKTNYEKSFRDDQEPVDLVDTPTTNKRNVISYTITSMRSGLVFSWAPQVRHQRQRQPSGEAAGAGTDLESDSGGEEEEEEEEAINEIAENIKIHVMRYPALYRFRRMMGGSGEPPRTPAVIPPPSGPSTPMGEYNNDIVNLILRDLRINTGDLYTIIYNTLLDSLRRAVRIAREDTDHNKAARQDAAAQIIQLISRNIPEFNISESMGAEMVRLRLDDTVSSETLADVVRESLDLPQAIHSQVIGIIGFARKWVREFVKTRKTIEAQLKEQEDLFEKLSKEMAESEKVDVPSLEYAPSIEWALEPMNSGFFEVEAIVQYGIQAAFSLVKRLLPQFADVEDPEVLQESPDAAVPFANIVAGEMVKSAALSPVRWLPATTTRNADMKIGQALKSLSQMFYDKYARVVRTKRFGDITTW